MKNRLRSFLVVAFVFVGTHTLFAQWVQVHGGYTYCFATVPNVNGGTDLLAGTSGEGVLRSTDAGTTWSTVSIGLPKNSGGGFEMVRSLALTPAGGGHAPNIFAGTDKGVYLSRNNAGGWDPAGSGLNGIFVHALAVNLNGPRGVSLFAGTDTGGVYSLIDDGDGWIQVDSGLTSKRVYTLAVDTDKNNRTNILAGTESGFFFSTDNGTSWSAGGRILSNTSISVLAITALAVKDTTLFAGTVGGGVFLSNDGGMNWTPVSNGLTGISVLALTISGPYLFAGMQNGGICVSSDCGANWRAVNAGLATSMVSGFALPPASGGSGAYLIAGGNGIWRRLLSEATTPPDLGTPTALGASDVSATAFVAHWTLAAGATTYHLDVATDPGFISFLYKDSDAGDVTSCTLKNQVTPSTTYYYRVRAVGVEGGSSGNSNTIVVTTDSAAFDIFRLAKDFHQVYAYKKLHHESAVPLYLPDNTVDSGRVEYLVLDSTRSGNASIVWKIQQTEHLIYHHWGYDYLIPFDTTYSRDSTSIIILFEDLQGFHEMQCDSRVWSFGRRVPYGDHVYRRWIDSSRNTVQYDESFTTVEHMYFDRTRGLYERHYQQLLGNNSHYNTYIDAQLLDPLTDVPLHALSTSPLGFALLQNYPNPFNPTTVIRYQLPAPGGVEGSGVGGVRLVVYDILGRELAVLVNEKKAPGSYEVRFDGSGLASGVYVYRLTAGNYAESRRMVLVK